MKKYIILLAISLIQLSSQTIISRKPPRVTLVIVIDQLADHYVRKLKSHFTDGLKKLFDEGVVYTNMRFPHAMPATAVGHTCLSTGVQPKDHGIVGNYWYDDAGNKIQSDHDTEPHTAVFNRDGSTGTDCHSAKNTLVDGISDNYMLFPPKYNKERSVYSLSIKSRSAVGMGNKKGKSIWFDADHGYFTSSKAFFDELPEWVKTFNDIHCSEQLKNSIWKTRYPINSKQYAYPQILNYDYCGYGKSLIENNCETLNNMTPNKKYEQDNSIYKVFLRTPAAADLLVNLAKKCIDIELKKNSNKELLLWVSFSNLDKVGHIYGPNCLESIDTIYHLDKQIGELINYTRKYVSSDDLCIVLTSDHGSMPIPELMQQHGYPAKRVNTTKIIKKLNFLIKKEFGLDDIVIGFKTPQFFLRENKLKTLKVRERNKIIRRLQKYLQAHPGIKHCWTFNQLKYLKPEPGSIEANFMNQLYAKRSGRLTCQTHPYCQFTRWETGTGHRTGYHYDTHIPLVIYQKNQFRETKISKPTLMTQFAPTMARILKIPKPSACISNQLPGLF